MITGLHYLRAIAAMMVVAHHATTLFPNRAGWSDFGASGVDIFFVISGFVMALTTQGTPATVSAPHTASMFLMRRIIRVVPLYWLALLWSIKGDILKGAFDPVVIKDFLFIPRFNPIYEGNIYPALVPGWTINYEMFFYAIFAASLFFRQYRYVVVFATILAATLVGSTAEVSSAPAKFYTSTIMMEFLYGILIYKISQASSARVSRVSAWLMLLAGFILLAFFNPGTIPRAYFEGLCAALIVYAAIPAFKGMNVPILHTLADASFSIYITHQFTFRLSRPLLNGMGTEHPGNSTIALALFVQMAVSALLGVLVHRWFEKPVTRWLNQTLMKPKDRHHESKIPPQGA